MAFELPIEAGLDEGSTKLLGEIGLERNRGRSISPDSRRLLAPLLEGTVTSSMRRKVTATSPFRVGRGPRAGKVSTFQGHNGGNIHSTVSRVAWPWPITLPSRSTLYPRTAITFAERGKSVSAKPMLSNASCNQPLPTKWPG